MLQTFADAAFSIVQREQFQQPEEEADTAVRSEEATRAGGGDSFFSDLTHGEASLLCCCSSSFSSSSVSILTWTFFPFAARMAGSGIGLAFALARFATAGGAT